MLALDLLAMRNVPLAAALAVLLCMVLTVPAHAVTADDLVPLDDPAYSALDYLQREGYLSWLPDGYFVPACHGGQLRSSLNIALNVAL